MKQVFFPEHSRGKADFGWLKARYSFSFANFFDPSRIQFGQLRVLNDDQVAPAMGFGKHPHKNMEIVTIPRSGALRHRDSMGNEGVIESGDIQIMSAGSGVEHSELNASTTEPVELFQIWVFPDTDEVEPRYDQKQISSLIEPNTLSTVVKPRDEAGDGELWVHQQAYFNLGRFDQDTHTQYSMHQAGHGAYLMVVEGSVKVNDQELGRRDALGIWDTDSIDLEITEGTELLLIEVPMN